MAIKRPNVTKRTINIDGPDGNAWALMGLASSWKKQMGEDPKPLLDEMQLGDYKNLILVFDREFGHICDLDTNNDDLLTALDLAHEKND